MASITATRTATLGKDSRNVTNMTSVAATRTPTLGKYSKKSPNAVSPLPRTGKEDVNYTLLYYLLGGIVLFAIICMFHTSLYFVNQVRT